MRSGGVARLRAINASRQRGSSVSRFAATEGRSCLAGERERERAVAIGLYVGVGRAARWCGRAGAENLREQQRRTRRHGRAVRGSLGGAYAVKIRVCVASCEAQALLDG